MTDDEIFDAAAGAEGEEGEQDDDLSHGDDFNVPKLNHLSVLSVFLLN